MNQKLLFFLFLLYGFHISAQPTFKNGYFIDNENQRKECLIKDLNWKNNPTSIEYKISIDSEPSTHSINEIKEFGIYENSRYLRSLVNIDRSTEIISDLNYERNPVFKEELLFLKVLIEGKANLYKYEDGNLRKFLFNMDDKPIEQLIFKTYLIDSNVAKNNNQYKQQLLNSFKSDALKNDRIEKVQYRESDLTNLFVFYHESQNLMFKKYVQKRDLDRFNFNIKPRLTFNTMEVRNNKSSVYFIDFDHETNVSLGVEFEMYLPFNNNKWSIFLEPTYQSFKSEKIQNQSNASLEVKHTINYSTIDLNFGFRYYAFLNKNSKIFANFAIIPNYIVDGKYEIINTTSFYSSAVYSLDLSVDYNLSFGIGYKFKNRYSVELRYNTERALTDNYVVWLTKYNTSGIVFGYTIF